MVPMLVMGRRIASRSSPIQVKPAYRHLSGGLSDGLTSSQKPSPSRAGHKPPTALTLREHKFDPCREGRLFVHLLRSAIGAFPTIVQAVGLPEVAATTAIAKRHAPLNHLFPSKGRDGVLGNHASGSLGCQPPLICFSSRAISARSSALSFSASSILRCWS